MKQKGGCDFLRIPSVNQALYFGNPWSKLLHAYLKATVDQSLKVGIVQE